MINIKYLSAIAAGGSLGSISRFLLSYWIGGLTGGGFPYGTLLLNISGSFGLGILASVLIGKAPAHLLWAFGAIGFLGSFTTFSTFSLELINLYRDGNIRSAVFYLTASVLVSLAGVIAGVWIGSCVKITAVP